jgi:hypothetical protein
MKDTKEIVVHPYRTPGDIEVHTGPKFGFIAALPPPPPSPEPEPEPKHECAAPGIDDGTLYEGKILTQWVKTPWYRKDKQINTTLYRGCLYRCEECYQIHKLVLKYPSQGTGDYTFLEWKTVDLDEWKSAGGIE